MTLAQYISKRNGVPLGHSASLGNMFYRSLGAGSFALFWSYWNPIFGYYLGKYVFKPFKNVLPSAISVILTFIICGALHDAVTTAVRGSLAIFFTPWFFFMSIGVVINKAVQLNYSGFPWLGRAAINLTYIGSCLALTIYLGL